MRRPLASVVYHCRMMSFCQGRSRNGLPARGPAVTFKPSTKRITRSARVRPLAFQLERRMGLKCEVGFAFWPSASTS
jgi:hypothetical protein